jgi:lipopolysaccharide/colanic/teichoic acid biosynthesis glycosyltransferase
MAKSTCRFTISATSFRSGMLMYALDDGVYDLWYIRNWSFGLDLQIIARTIFTALRNQNEY